MIDGYREYLLTMLRSAVPLWVQHWRSADPESRRLRAVGLESALAESGHAEALLVGRASKPGVLEEAFNDTAEALALVQLSGAAPTGDLLGIHLRLAEVPPEPPVRPVARAERSGAAVGQSGQLGLGLD